MRDTRHVARQRWRELKRRRASRDATIIFAIVFALTFAAFSPLILISRVDARHTGRTINEQSQNQP
jgi:hypothetical protein